MADDDYAPFTPQPGGPRLEAAEVMGVFELESMEQLQAFMDKGWCPRFLGTGYAHDGYDANGKNCWKFAPLWDRAAVNQAKVKLDLDASRNRVTAR